MLNQILLSLSEECIAFLIGVYFYAKLDRAFRLIVIQVSIAFIVEISGAFLTKNKIPNVFLFNLYLIFDCGLLLYASFFLVFNKHYNYFLRIGFIVFFIVWLLNSYYKNALKTFNNYAYQTASLLLITAYLIVLYYEAIRNSKSIVKSPTFWVCISITLFYGCNIGYFSFKELLNKSERQFLLLFLDILNSVRYLLIAYAFLLFYLNQNLEQKLNTHER